MCYILVLLIYFFKYSKLLGLSSLHSLGGTVIIPKKLFLILKLFNPTLFLYKVLLKII